MKAKTTQTLWGFALWPLAAVEGLFTFHPETLSAWVGATGLTVGLLIPAVFIGYMIGSQTHGEDRPA